MTEQRLPTVNGDDGAWGTILNQYISKEHYNTGSDNAANGGHKTITVQAGTATAGTAPIKLTSGTLLGTPEAGAIEFLTDAFYGTITTGTARKQFAVIGDDITLNPAPADLAFSGIKVSLDAGESLTSGQICYLKSDGKMWLAKANAEATSGTCLIALATATIGANNTGVFLLKGFFQNATLFNMTPCKPQFISAATGGAITETAPNTATNIVRIVGYSKTADIIYFDPDKTYLEI